MAFYLMAQSHYLNQCWLIIIHVLWHSTVGNFTGMLKTCIFEMSSLKIQWKFSQISIFIPETAHEFIDFRFQPSSSIDRDGSTHWGRVTHICVGTNTNIGSDNGLSPGRCQAIIWTNAGILLIGPLGTNFRGILSEIHTFSFKKMHFKTSSAK